MAVGVLTAALTVLTTGQGRLALGVALDFWLAAGLLRLGQTPGWTSLLVTVLIIVIRQLAGRALRSPPVRPGELFTALRGPRHARGQATRR